MLHVPLLRNLVIAVIALGGSYLVAGFVNAPALSRPRLTSTYRSGTVIVVAPAAEQPADAAPSTVPAQAPEPAAATLRAL